MPCLRTKITIQLNTTFGHGLVLYIKIMKDSRVIIYLILSVWCCSCTGAEELANEPISISISAFSPNFDISTLVHDIEYNVLEDTTHAFHRIDKIVQHQGRFYILDKEFSKRLYVYDTLGQLLHVHSRFPDGSLFEAPNDFSINEVDNSLTIFEDSRKSLLHYASNGEFLSDEAIDFTPRNICYHQSKLFSYLLTTRKQNNSDSNPSLVILDTQNKSDKTILSIKDYPWIRYYYANHFSSNPQRKLFVPKLSNTIYELEQNTIREAYHLDVGNSGFPANFLDTLSMPAQASFSETIQQHDYTFFAGGLVESESHIFFRVKKQGKLYFVFYDKKSGQTIAFDSITLGDKTQEIVIWGMPIFAVDDRMFTYVQAADLITLLEQRTNSIDEPTLEKLKQLNMDSNPVLMSYRLKKIEPKTPSFLH